MVTTITWRACSLGNAELSIIAKWKSIWRKVDAVAI
jgi:hypothetical protein